MKIKHLINTSQVLSDKEKQEWIDILPKMTKGQIERLRDTLILDNK